MLLQVLRYGFKYMRQVMTERRIAIKAYLVLVFLVLCVVCNLCVPLVFKKLLLELKIFDQVGHKLIYAWILAYACSWTVGQIMLGLRNFMEVKVYTLLAEAMSNGFFAHL